MTMQQQLLFETFGPIQLQLVESRNGALVAEGEFGYCDRPTSNGRVYPREIMEREFDRLRPKMKSGGLFGELDHPEDGKTKLQRVAMIIEDMRIESNGRVVGRFRVIEGTPNGDTLAAIVRSGGQVGVSSRGIGSTVTEGTSLVVQEDFRLFGYDAVAEPAVSTALPAFEDKGSSKRSKRSREMEESAQYLTDRQVEDLIEANEQIPPVAHLLALTEGLQERDRDMRAELREMREQMREKDRLLHRAQTALVNEQQEREQMEEELSQLEQSNDRLIQEANLSKLTLWSVAADAILNQALPCIHSEHREHFMRLVGKPAQLSSLQEFDARVKIHVEEFERTHRATRLDADLVLEQAHLLSQASESLKALYEQAEHGVTSSDLLATASAQIKALQEEVEQVPRLERNVATLEEQLHTLREAHRNLKKTYKSLREDYATITEQLDNLEKTAKRASKITNQLEDVKLENERLRLSLSAQHPKRMYEALKHVREPNLLKEEAEAFLRRTRRASAESSEPAPTPSGVGTRQEAHLNEDERLIAQMRDVASRRQKRAQEAGSFVESAQSPSLQPPGTVGVSPAWETPLNEEQGDSNIMNLMRRMTAPRT
jgi:hypothetical protein